jgi:hypothetical protein
MFWAMPTMVAAQTAPVRFDVPAMVEAAEVLNECCLDPADPYEHLIEIVIPVSSWIEAAARDSISEFRFDVYWNRNAFPIVDYAPRTLMQSQINGVIAVENHNDRSLKLGGATNVPTPNVSLAANAETVSSSGTIRRFEEVPEQELLVASGSVHRGTGAFYRFHTSRQFSLEGSRELRLVFRVPRSWRTGLVRVDCAARGELGRFPSGNAIEAATAFVLPIYMQGDHEARQLTIEYVRQEQALRSSWARHQQSQPAATILNHLQRAFKKDSVDEIAESWAIDLIQSVSEPDLAEASPSLPSSVRTTARQFVDSRRRLMDANSSASQAPSFAAAVVTARPTIPDPNAGSDRRPVQTDPSRSDAPPSHETANETQAIGWRRSTRSD